MYELKKILQHHYMCVLQPKLDPSIISEYLSARWNSQMSYFHNFVIFLEQQVTKKMLQPENMSLLKNMLPLSTAAHITKCARSPPINSPCWDLSGLKQMRYRNTENGKLKLCSWWNHEWQVSTQSVQHNIWKWVNHGHIFHIVNVATCSCFLLQLLFLDTPLPGLFCPEKASKK